MFRIHNNLRNLFSSKRSTFSNILFSFLWSSKLLFVELWHTKILSFLPQLMEFITCWFKNCTSEHLNFYFIVALISTYLLISFISISKIIAIERIIIVFQKRHIYTYVCTYTTDATKCVTLLRIRAQGNYQLCQKQCPHNSCITTPRPPPLLDLQLIQKGFHYMPFASCLATININWFPIQFCYNMHENHYRRAQWRSFSKTLVEVWIIINLYLHLLVQSCLAMLNMHTYFGH